ncbi:right-handed parallel beta-helix repeat-containing protein, partial [Crossiella equi]
RCQVHDNGEEGIDVKYSPNARAKIHDNRVWNNRGPNIYVDSSSRVEVYNNVVGGTRNSSKSGIALAVEDYAEERWVSDVSIHNNVMHGNAQAGISFWVESSGVFADIRIVNNTFHGNRNGAIGFYGGDFEGSNVLRNNIFDRDVRHPDFAVDHNFTGDPGFVDPGAGDFHLTPAAVRAIDQGSAVGAPAFDADNRPRPAGAGVDLGAYEVRRG